MEGVIFIIELTNGQKLAVEKGRHWFKTQYKQVFEIAGYAGTGKTTVVNTLIDELQLDKDDVLFTAFVGKATLVLSMKGCKAKTICSTFYDCIDVAMKDELGNVIIVNGKVRYSRKFIKKKELPSNIKLIIIDEASMLNETYKADILSFNIPIIVLGDLHQLPPVFGDPAFLQEPDVVLTEIMRQQEDNPIVYLATLARNGIRLPLNQYADKCLVCNKSDIKNEYDIYRNSDIVICGKNVTRDMLNNFIRTDVYGIKSPDIIEGDKIICRQNNWNECLNENIFLINGMVGYVVNIDKKSYDGRNLRIDFRPEFMEDNYFLDIDIDYKYMNLPHDRKKTYVTYANKFEYGYAITCHLSQGSQYNKVLVYNEYMGDRDYYSKWLYTAITRAIDKLVVAY